MNIKILYDSRAEQGFMAGWSFSCLVEVGCAHPGLEPIIKECGIQSCGVIGGFHGFSQFEILKDALMVCPCHCTPHIKELEDIYPHAYRYCAAGCSITIGDHL